MEFRKMVTITLYTRQQKETLMYSGLCGRGRGWDDLGEWHWNMNNIIYEMSHQSRFNARYWMLGAGALGWPRGMVRGGRRGEGSGWGTLVYLWWIHFDIWQNEYNIVKLKNKIILKKKEREKKSRDTTLPAKVCLVKAMVFPVVTYGCESWTVKKVERRRIHAFNCGVGEDSWEFLGLQRDPTNPS